jgi:hypothetical protein
MSYLTNIAISGRYFASQARFFSYFCCAAPLVLAFSSFVAYGLNSLTH